MSWWQAWLIWLLSFALGVGVALWDRRQMRQRRVWLLRMHAACDARMTVCRLDGTRYRDMPTLACLLDSKEYAQCVTEDQFIDAIRNEVHHATTQ